MSIAVSAETATRKRTARAFSQRAAAARRGLFQSPYTPKANDPASGLSDREIAARWLLVLEVPEAVQAATLALLEVIELDVLRRGETQTPASYNYLRAALGARLGLAGPAPERLFRAALRWWRTVGWGTWQRGFGFATVSCPNVYTSTFLAWKTALGRLLAHPEWALYIGQATPGPTIGTFTLPDLDPIQTGSPRSLIAGHPPAGPAGFWPQLTQATRRILWPLWRQHGPGWVNHAPPWLLDAVLPLWFACHRSPA